MGRFPLVPLSLFLVAVPNVIWAQSADTGSKMTLASSETESFAFGIPQKSLVYGELGYSILPRLGFQTAMSDTLSIGGEFILDIGLFNSLGSNIPGTVTVAGGVPIRLMVMDREDFGLRLSFTPGVGWTSRTFSTPSLAGFPSFSATTNAFALLLHSEADIRLLELTDGVRLGANVRVPFTIFAGDFSNVLVPLMAGPTVEWDANEDLSIFGRLALGPHIIAGDGGRVDFGLAITVGASYGLDI